MERRSIIKLAGLTTFGLMAGGNLFASALKINSHQLIEIEPPSIHVRHGFFNIQSSHNNGLHIQRDILNGDGLEQISKNRIVSIKISDEKTEIYGISDEKDFKSKSSELSAIKLEANKVTSVYVESGSLLFSELEEITINDGVVKSDQARIQNSNGLVELSSEIDQSVYIYKQANISTLL